MKTVLAAALLALAIPAQAKVALEAPLQDGAVVLLHDVAGPCVGGALLAQYVSSAGVITPGCWVKRPGHVAIVFLDGDVGAVPDQALRPPKQI